MNLAAQTATHTVHLQQHYRFSPQQVFNAWSDPSALTQWFGPHSHKCKVERYDFKKGGAYQIRLIPVSEETDCSGDPSLDSVCAGEFVEIIEAQRIAMTFRWIENGADMDETLLTIEIRARDDGTDLTLIHERLPDIPIRDAHAAGWQGCLECLQAFLSTNYVAPNFA